MAIHAGLMSDGHGIAGRSRFEAAHSCVEVPYIITEAVLDEHGVQFLVHGDDNFNTISEDRLIILPRTPAISSSMLLAYNRRIKIMPYATDSDCVAKMLYERQTANNPDSRTTRRIGN